MRGCSCIWGVSDLHADNQVCMSWIKQLSARPADTLIVAGDVATDETLIEESLVVCVLVTCDVASLTSASLRSALECICSACGLMVFVWGTAACQ